MGALARGATGQGDESRHGAQGKAIAPRLLDADNLGAVRLELVLEVAELACLSDARRPPAAGSGRLQ
eukprot:10316089-Lingulodinium_polyedra.AAC.1